MGYIPFLVDEDDLDDLRFELTLTWYSEDYLYENTRVYIIEPLEPLSTHPAVSLEEAVNSYQMEYAEW